MVQKRQKNEVEIIKKNSKILTFSACPLWVGLNKREKKSINVGAFVLTLTLSLLLFIK